MNYKLRELFLKNELLFLILFEIFIQIKIRNIFVVLEIGIICFERIKSQLVLVASIVVNNDFEIMIKDDIACTTLIKLIY